MDRGIYRLHGYLKSLWILVAIFPQTFFLVKKIYKQDQCLYSRSNDIHVREVESVHNNYTYISVMWQIIFLIVSITICHHRLPNAWAYVCLIALGSLLWLDSQYLGPHFHIWPIPLINLKGGLFEEPSFSKTPQSRSCIQWRVIYTHHLHKSIKH